MKNYKYFNGEKENPFEGKDFGKALSGRSNDTDLKPEIRRRMGNCHER